MLRSAKPACRPRQSLTSQRRRRQTTTAYLFILPGMLLFVAWTLYPLLYSLVMSFAERNLIKPSRFVGLDNYTRALSDPVFWLALRNTLLLAVITVPGQADPGPGPGAAARSAAARARVLPHDLLHLVVTSWVVVSLIFTDTCTTARPG